ncbi:MAG: DUF2007 domain-containing protein [Proteobacteria bacterium]|nr:DUF2007 domain-containing protein [Pseudomonadota bacterium]
MRVVYLPSDLIDAHLVKGVLEQEGIPVYLRGEHLAGGIGELPVIGLYALCVPDVCGAQARGVVEALERDRRADASDIEEQVDTGGEFGMGGIIPAA